MQTEYRTSCYGSSFSFEFDLAKNPFWRLPAKEKSSVHNCSKSRWIRWKLGFDYMGSKVKELQPNIV